VRALDPCLPPTRDWRRFCKKAHSVERVGWIGRGGLGSWTFSAGRAGSSLTRVEFEPTRPSLGGGASDAVDVDELGIVPQAHRSPQLVPAAVHAQRRRSSTVSLAETCLSSLSLTNTSTTTAGGASDYSLWSESPTHSFASLASPSPSLGASSPPFGSFSAAGKCVSPRKGSSGAIGELTLGPSPPGLGFGSIGGGGGGGGAAHRRRSSSAAVGQAQAYHAQPSAGLGLALHSTPASQQHGWAASPSSAPVPIPGATSTKSQQQQQASTTGAATSPVSPRSFAQIAARPNDKPWTRSASAAASASASTVSAGWAEPPTNGVSTSASAAGSGGAGKRTKGDGSPTQGRRTRGGQGRRREATK